MGEIAPGRANAPKEVHVLVTGFGPWGSNTVNPAGLIAQAVQQHLQTQHGAIIHVHGLPAALDVSYKTVRSSIPHLLFPPVTNNPPPTFDAVLFIGMAGTRSYYSVESRAFRDDYRLPDADGEIPTGTEESMWKQLYNAPEELRPCWDADDVWRRWKDELVDFDIRVSDDAGRYLCEFVYFTGLVEYWRRGRASDSRVAFLHVPAAYDSESISKGVRATEALIKAIVDSEDLKGHLRAKYSK